jgi:hypothetical protein
MDREGVIEGRRGRQGREEEREREKGREGEKEGDREGGNLVDM